jgi:hypothetical protein
MIKQQLQLVGKITKESSHKRKSCHRTDVNVTTEEFQIKILMGKWFC